jgi:LmbE family N-acetylglucosaminyl deacetylase
MKPGLALIRWNLLIDGKTVEAEELLTLVSHLTETIKVQNQTIQNQNTQIQAMQTQLMTLVQMNQQRELSPLSLETAEEVHEEPDGFYDEGYNALEEQPIQFPDEVLVPAEEGDE